MFGMELGSSPMIQQEGEKQSLVLMLFGQGVVYVWGGGGHSV